MALINQALVQSNFELVRDAIAAILADELGTQGVLHAALPTPDKDLVALLNDLKIVTERYAEFSESDYPVIDVYLFNDDFDNKNRSSVRGNTSYHIDLYFKGEKQDLNGNEKGDEVTSKRAHRIAGMIQKIFEFGGYITLGFPPGIIGRTLIASIKRPEEEPSRDSFNMIMYRVVFEVEVAETFGVVDGQPLRLHTTTVEINETGIGFEWIFDGTKATGETSVSFSAGASSI